ncbi:MAG: thymidylate kinase [Terracidiphilus sp.]
MHLSRKVSHKTVITFSGIDGAGKTTQIRNLCAKLREAGLRLHLVVFWDDVARLTRFREAAGHALFKGDRGIGTPAAPINRRDKNIRSWWMSFMRLCLYSVDAFSTRAAVQRALRSDANVIVFDRFIYDELANLNLRNFFMRAYARLIAKVVPRPQISYLMDADPKQARARKPEYPVEFLIHSRQSYLALSKLIGGMKVIESMSLQEAEREVLKHALKVLPLEGSRGNPKGPATGGIANELARLEGTQSRPATP